VALGVAVVALAPRIGYVLANPGGYSGTFAYDPSVYYGSAAAMLHGRWPYADFVLLHPPLGPIVLMPFAALGALTRDSVGFIAAQFAFAVIGSVNAGLVYVVARRFGIANVGAAVGGLCYALWPGASGAEFASRLEPLGNLAVLLALLALTRAERTSRRMPTALCGAGLAVACCIKFWWLAPLVVVLAWHLVPSRRHRVTWFAAGAAVPIVAVNLPFFIVAPRAMLRMVVIDQINRPSQPLPFIDRLSGLSGIGDIDLEPTLTVAIIAGCALAAALAVLARAARGHRYGPLLVTLTLTTAVIIVAVPSYFPYYDDYIAPFLSLLAAVAARHLNLRADARGRLVMAGLAAFVVALTAIDIGTPRRAVFPYPATALRPAVTAAHCVVSDSPMALIELDVLDRDLARGCPNWVDVTGQAIHLGMPRDRILSVVWQRRVVRYLLAGDVLTLFRPLNTGVSPELDRVIGSLPRLATDGDFEFYDSSKPLPRQTRQFIADLMTQPLAAATD
jgi:hypothetical protein